MSPRTTTVSHPSSSLKEVPRAALFFPLTSDIVGAAATLTDDLIEITSTASTSAATTDDLNQGLKALADASIPAERISSPTEEEGIISHFNEDEILGKLFTSSDLDESKISQIYSDYCRPEMVPEARVKLTKIIEKSDSLLQSKSISMSLKNIFPLFIQRVIEQETKRTGKTDFTNLLLDDLFLSASATVILMLPRLISILFRVEDVASTLNSNLFDVLLTIEQVLKALPELLKLPETRRRLNQMEQILLEESVWRVSGNEGGSCTASVIYELLRMEFKSIACTTKCPLTIISTLSGIRSSQRALETLSGFPSTGGGFRLSRLELFFRKFLRLAAQRLQLATFRLGLSPAVTQLSWELFFDLVQREGSHHQDQQDREDSNLFKNRHLNQILLSTIYCSSHLLEEGRTFSQISQVLPSNTTWLTKTRDFYSFYNEMFVPPLRKRIESFLQRRSEEKAAAEAEKGNLWILDGFLTTAPFPKNPQFQLTTNITVNRLNRSAKKPRVSPTTRYEWIDPTKSKSKSEADPSTPTQKSHLLNYSITEEEQPVLKRFNTDDGEGFKLKKIARGLNFSEAEEGEAEAED